jgi:hypothetical protein
MCSTGESGKVNTENAEWKVMLAALPKQKTSAGKA